MIDKMTRKLLFGCESISQSISVPVGVSINDMMILPAKYPALPKVPFGLNKGLRKFLTSEFTGKHTKLNQPKSVRILT